MMGGKQGMPVLQSRVDPQTRLWEAMRNQQLDGFRFIRQVLIEPFIVDFACIEHKFVVELDDSPHSEQQYYDLCRTRYLRERGYTVQRFWYSEVVTNLSGVVARLRVELAKCSGQ